MTKGMSMLYDSMEKIGMAQAAMRESRFLIAQGDLDDGFSLLVEAVTRLEGERRLTDSGQSKGAGKAPPAGGGVGADQRRGGGK